jgi:hypothetical protein
MTISLFNRRSFLACLTLALSCPAGNAVIYDITQQSGLVSPNFRGQANTTYFGWNEGQFFGQPVPPTASRILDNPVTSFGNVGPGEGVELYQIDRLSSPFVMIGSTAGNIYTGDRAIGKQAAATLVVPTSSGALASGFTTIVVQGRTTTAGGFSTLDLLLSNYPVFSSINGVSPDFVIAGNAANQGQWWLQYNLPGSASAYSIGMTFPGGAGTTPVSIAGMSVDTYWSTSGYANVGAVPEPSTFALLAAAAGVCLTVHYRRRPHSQQ